LLEEPVLEEAQPNNESAEVPDFVLREDHDAELHAAVKQ
jgi:hypothetical protein